MIDETTREIERRRVAGLLSHRRAPLPEEIAHPLFVLGVAHRRRIGHPQIYLERAVALAAEFPGPGIDPVGGGHQRAKPAHAAGIGDRGGEPDRAGPGHRRHQDRHAQAKAPAEDFGTLPGAGI